MVPSTFGNEIVEPEYLEIADYYDDRKAVVTVTGDDLGRYSDINSYFKYISVLKESCMHYYI